MPVTHGVTSSSLVRTARHQNGNLKKVPVLWFNKPATPYLIHYIGCEKFPQHNTLSFMPAGIS